MHDDRVDRPSVDAQGCLAVDISCRRCSYNLRGLREEGACPECGSAVGLSTRGNFLRYADPKWVETIAKGIRTILWGILVAIFGSCAAGGAQRSGAGLAPLAPILALAASLVGLFGVWMLTEPDPSHVGEDRYARARQYVRIALLVGLAGGLIDILETAIPSDPAVALVFGLISFGVGIVMIVGEFFKFVYIEHLASRIPDDLLARRARTLRWSMVIAILILTLAGITLAIGVSATIQTLTVLGGIGLAIGGIFYLIVGIASLLFYFRLSKRLKEQAELALAGWARESAMVNHPNR